MRKRSTDCGRTRLTRISHLMLKGALLSLVTVSSLEGGTLLQQHLSTVKDVQVVVVSSALSYAPPPGFTRESFDQEVERRVSTVLEHCGVASNPSSPLQLLVDMGGEGSGTIPKLMVVELGIELREPATLVRPWTLNGGSDPMYVTSWRTWDVVVSSPAETMARILDTIEVLVGRFAQKAAQARLDRLEGGTLHSAVARLREECLDQ